MQETIKYANVWNHYLNVFVFTLVLVVTHEQL